MKYINKLNSDPFQRAFLTGNPGQRIQADFRYMPTQELWMMSLQYNDFVLNGINIVTSPNMLRGYHNIIPFGIACITTDNLDPYRLTDFDTEYAKLYLLSREEVLRLEEVFE